MAPTRKPEAPPQAHERRGNDEQEPEYPYGGEQDGHPPSKDDYLPPKREHDVATDLKKSGDKAADDKAADDKAADAPGSRRARSR